MPDFTASGIRADFDKVVANGEPVRFRYFTGSYPGAGSYFDELDLTQSGADAWTSGLHFPVGASEQILMEQGRLKQDDRVLYVRGSVSVSGTFRIGVGSPTVRDEYAPVDEGIKPYVVGGQNVYHKIMMRRLPTGSFVGEEA